MPEGVTAVADGTTLELRQGANFRVELEWSEDAVDLGPPYVGIFSILRWAAGPIVLELRSDQPAEQGAVTLAGNLMRVLIHAAASAHLGRSQAWAAFLSQPGDPASREHLASGPLRFVPMGV